MARDEALVQAVVDDKLASGALNQARVAKSSALAMNLSGVVGRSELYTQLDQALEQLQAARREDAPKHGT